jgi:putative lipoprotein
MRNRISTILILAIIACSGKRDVPAKSADSTPPPSPNVVDSVTATITYRQRMALPDNAHIKVTLEDVSRVDAPARVISSEDRMAGGAQVPFVFSLPYVLNQLPMNARLVVRVRIEEGDKLLFTSTSVHPVVTQGAPKAVEVVVEPVRAE